MVAGDEDIAGLLASVGEVLGVGNVPHRALCPTPRHASGLAHIGDGKHEIAVGDRESSLVAIQSGDSHLGDVAVDLLHLSKHIGASLHVSVDEVEVETWHKVLGTLCPVFLFDAHHLVDDDLVGIATGINVEIDNAGKTELKRVGGDRAHLILSAGTDDSAIVCLDSGERTAVAVEVGETVEPESAALQRTIEDERTSPHVGVARIFFVYLGQHESAIARGGDIVVVVVSLYPCRRVVEEDIGSRAVADADRHVVVLVEKHLLVVESSADGATIVHDSTSVGGLWWRSHSNALHLSEEVAHVWRLVVAVHLPYHGVAVLLVREQRTIAILGRVCSGVDAYLVVGRTCHDFLTPVAKDVALKARCGLGVVVAQRTVGRWSCESVCR